VEWVVDLVEHPEGRFSHLVCGFWLARRHLRLRNQPQHFKLIRDRSMAAAASDAWRRMAPTSAPRSTFAYSKGERFETLGRNGPAEHHAANG
jgi:hypothetical protein